MGFIKKQYLHCCIGNNTEFETETLTFRTQLSFMS